FVYKVKYFIFLLSAGLPQPTLFPYTTLFRSRPDGHAASLKLVAFQFTESRFCVWLNFQKFVSGSSVTFVLVTVHAVNGLELAEPDRKSTRLNSSHVAISYAVFCLKKKKIVCL